MPVWHKLTEDLRRSGELLVIGGLIDKQTRSDHRRIPILGDIPIIGRLFSSEDEFEQKTQVVFLLRIRILTSAEKARYRTRIPMTRDERTQLAEDDDDENGDGDGDGEEEKPDGD